MFREMNIFGMTDGWEFRDKKTKHNSAIWYPFFLIRSMSYAN